MKSYNKIGGEERDAAARHEMDGPDPYGTVKSEKKSRVPSSVFTPEKRGCGCWHLAALEREREDGKSGGGGGGGNDQIRIGRFGRYAPLFLSSSVTSFIV